jgi:hypothetical protein
LRRRADGPEALCEAVDRQATLIGRSPLHRSVLVAVLAVGVGGEQAAGEAGGDPFLPTG